MKKKVMKYPYTRILAVLLLFLFIALSALIFTGCGTKKKTVEREKTEVKKESASDTSAVEEIKAEEKKAVSEKEKLSEMERVVEYEGKPGDSLVEETKHPDGTTTKRTWKGSGKIKENYKEKESEKAKAEESKSDYQKDFKAVSKNKLDEASSSEKLIKDKEVKSGFSWFWFWLIIIVIVLLLLIYLNNRFKLVNRVTSFFNK